MTEPAATHDLWRVYRREWVIVYSLNAVLNRADPLADHLPVILSDGVSEYFEAHYAGRVADDDVRFGSEILGLTAHAQLELFLPNLKAEFKHRADAETYLQRRLEVDVDAVPLGGRVYHVVQRNSTQEQELLSYGVKKLPTP